MRHAVVQEKQALECGFYFHRPDVPTARLTNSTAELARPCALWCVMLAALDPAGSSA